MIGRATRLSALWLGLMVLHSPGEAADDLALNYGRWTVAQRGFGWACRLSSLAIVESSRAGEPLVVGYERVEGGALKVWGSSRVDPKAVGPLASRWYSASWISGGSTIVVKIRPDAGGRLLVLVREQPKDRTIGELVRQVILEPDRAETLPVAGDSGRATLPRVALRFDHSVPASPRSVVSAVFVAGRDGEGARPVALPDGFATASHPCWSPDGRWIAFAAFDPDGRDPLIRVAPASGGPSTAIASGTSPTWSWDGSKIAYVASGRSAYATDWSTPGRNDERVESITLAGPDAGSIAILARGLWPRWSPVDDRLAFVGRAEANWDVYVRSGDGLALSRVTDDPALDTQPCWSADGRSVVFLSDRGNRWDLFRARPEAGAVADRLTDHVRREDNPSLSPDGHFVAFIDRRSRPEGSILILDLGRGTVRPFPERPDGDLDPAWSPDGRSIAFVSRRPGPLLETGGPRP
jgi:Tol biopolymer transport system component